MICNTRLFSVEKPIDNHMENKPLILNSDYCQIEELEPSPSSPPNNTDDPGTTAKKCWEINTTFGIDHAKAPNEEATNFRDYALDMNYGASKDLQAKLVLHYISEAGESSIGRAEVGAKKGLYEIEKSKINFAIFPTVDFMISKSAVVSKGLPDTGTNLTIPLLISKRLGSFILVSNIGFVLPLNDKNRATQTLLSLAGGMNINESSILTAELFRSSVSSFRRNATTSIGLGNVDKLTNKILFYFSIGKTIGNTSDGADHLNVLNGFKFFFGSGEK